jgi:hypothetical protein
MVAIRKLKILKKTKYPESTDILRLSYKKRSCQNLCYLISVLSIVQSNKRPKLSSKLWPKLTLQAEIIGCGIIDKTRMCEAANDSGT